MDTWHILEQRFHDIGNRDHNVVMDFHSDNSEECSYSLSGPVKEGESRGVIVGGLLDEPKGKPDFSTSHYSVGELWDTLHRAGKLLNRQEQQPQRYDHTGAKRFVAMLLKEHGSLAHEEGRRKFFANAARICGMMAGKLATAMNPEQDRWSNGRSKADWLAIKHMTTDQWNAMRKANAERIQHVQGNQRSWQFKRSLCDERGFLCPEFAGK